MVDVVMCMMVYVYVDDGCGLCLLCCVCVVKMNVMCIGVLLNDNIVVCLNILLLLILMCCVNCVWHVYSVCYWCVCDWCVCELLWLCCV